MGYRTIEEMYTKDGIFVDRINRFTDMDGVDGAVARNHFFLYNCAADPNLAWAKCVIMDDDGAVYKNDEYKAKVSEE